MMQKGHPKSEHTLFFWSRLERACRQGDYPELHRLLGTAGDALASSTSSSSSSGAACEFASWLLALTSRHGHLSCVTYLIEYGVKIDALVTLNASDIDHGVLASMMVPPHEKAATALYWACAHGHNQVVDVLLRKGANPNVGQHPLVVACQQGHVRVVQRLLSVVVPQQANKLNAMVVPQNLVFTPLTCRDKTAQRQVLSVLLHDHRVNALARHVDDDDDDCTGQTLLHKACQKHDARLVELVLTHPRAQGLINMADRRGNTALDMVAGSRLDDAVVQCLMYHGANPTSIGKTTTTAGLTPLHKAVQSARLVQVQALLSCPLCDASVVNAPATTLKHNGQTPLMQACHEYWQSFADGGEMRDVVLALLHDARLDVNQADAQGRTILHHACAAGLTWMVQLLLSVTTCYDTINVHAPDADGQTALHWACRHNHLACVRLLVRHGASLVTPRDRAGQTPLSHALLQGDHCVELLYYVMREHQGWTQFVL